MQPSRWILLRGAVRGSEILLELGNAANADPSQANGLSLEFGGGRAAGPLCIDGPSALDHRSLVASTFAKWGVHEIEAGARSG
jgi:hypothetical protein